MIYERINFEENVYIDVYAADKIADYRRKAILVIPGGAYYNVEAGREGEPIAHAFIPHGYNAFVLHYSVRSESDKVFPAQLIETSKAIKYIKDNADKYNIDPENVFVVGFSAGGHLAASIGTMWDNEAIYDEIEMPYGYNKPKGMMLIYPVITAKYHNMSIKNLINNQEASQEELEPYNIENHISEKTVPAYIVHTSNDEIVNIKNSLILAEALSDNNLEFEMHIYPDAPHGVALGNEITECNNPKWNNPCIAKWIENAVAWANELEKKN